MTKIKGHTLPYEGPHTSYEPFVHGTVASAKNDCVLMFRLYKLQCSGPEMLAVLKIVVDISFWWSDATA